MSLHHLSHIQLPRPHFQRDKPKRTVPKRPEFWQNYDTQTLIYDAIHCPQKREVRVLMPRSFNFGTLLKTAQISIDGKPTTRPRWRRWRHHETLTFKNQPSAKTLSLQIADQRFDVPINPIDTELAGLNVVYTLSRNNNLSWMRDWAKFHVQTHNLQAVVVFDNGSTAYDLAAIDQTLSDVPGIQQVRVINADLPFGPLDEDCTFRTDAKYLQVAMLNLARDRFMPMSRAWLNLDIDELLISPSGENIFDATVADRWGHLTFPGYWHYSDPDAPATHATHRLVRPGDAACPSKFALRPDGLFGGFSLQVHSLERINRKFNFASERFWFIHCHAISTSWKYKRMAAQGPFLPASDLALAELNLGFAP